MKRSYLLGAICAASALLSFGPANAGDLFNSASYNWSGFYVGLNAGWAKNSTDWAFHPAIVGAPNQSFSFEDNAGALGGHIGLQHQWGSFVLGVEAAVSDINVNGGWSEHFGYGIGNSLAETKTGTLVTVGPRLGWANGRWLYYGTGGWATADVQTRGESIFSPGSFFNKTSERQNGWFAGGGVEYALSQNVLAGIEYQHVDLGDELHCPGCFAGDTNNHEIGVGIDIVRARLSFKLGRDEDLAPSPLK
ncbi:outer membrane protein [Hyphomicrobium sp. 2TAF46]|uniref:outer membrane protein n=1 Tax=Hyphomicrobium sp. 2TAF46 TaxID=3233019 RepID=UPI003F8EDE04